MLCQVFTANIWGFSPSSDFMQWELQDRSSEFIVPTPAPAPSASLNPLLPPACMYPVSLLGPRSDRSLSPGLGTAIPCIRCCICCADAAVPQSSLKDRRCPGPSVRCPPCVCVSLVPQGGLVRCRGSAESAQLSGAALGGRPRPRVPQSPSRPCPRYLRGGGRRPPLVERGGGPCARVERRAEAGGGQAESPVRVLHPQRGQGSQEADTNLRKRAGSAGRRLPLRPAEAAPGRVNRPARAAPGAATASARLATRCTAELHPTPSRCPCGFVGNFLRDFSRNL